MNAGFPILEGKSQVSRMCGKICYGVELSSEDRGENTHTGVHSCRTKKKLLPTLTCPLRSQDSDWDQTPSEEDPQGAVRAYDAFMGLS